MPQSRNDHSDDGDLDVGTGLIEDEEIEARAPGNIDAGQHLIVGVVDRTDIWAAARLGRRMVAWRQKGMVPQAQRRETIETRFLAGSSPHEAYRQELVQLRQRTQHGNARIEVRARTELDIFLSVLHPVQYRHLRRNAEIACDVPHPLFASRFCKL